MEQYTFYIGIVVVLVAAILAFYMNYKNGKGDATAIISIISVIMADLAALLATRNSYEGILQIIVNRAHSTICNSNLSKAQKDYWNKERIEDFVHPILLEAIKKIEQNKKKP